MIMCYVPQIVKKYGQEMQHLHTAAQHTTPRGVV